MATDFFDRQAAARRSTAWLLSMFALAVLFTTGAVFALMWMIVVTEETFDVDQQRVAIARSVRWQAPSGAALGTLALILGGSLYKVAALRAGGGRGVAESLGGRQLVRDATKDLRQRQLLNVVDEMAIASGTPAPPVYLIDDQAINAFAAGYSPSDAVIGVTQGCVDQLSRDELQGVIAHEFSHILNGDMRMSIRLIGVLHGILLLGLVGQLILRTIFHGGMHYDSRRSGSDDSGKGGAGILVILVIGFALVAIGSIGSLFGGLIKAAVSRQREYLADASAVQFTRNPLGIAGALKRILGLAAGSSLSHPRAGELSHMYFAQGVWEGFTSLMATHPPLPKRIRAIDPSWDGSAPRTVAPVGVVASGGLAAGFMGSTQETAETVSVAALDAAVDQIGDPVEAHREYAAELIQSIPDLVREAASEPATARAVVYGLLLDQDPDIRLRQREALADTADAAVVRFLFGRLVEVVDDLDPRVRLPLIDLSLPSLAAMSAPQYQRFSRSFRAMVLADERLSLFEWMLSQVLQRHLRPHFERVRSPRIHHKSLYPLSQQCGVVLSTLAYNGGQDTNPEKAYAAGREVLGEAPPHIADRSACTLGAMRESLELIASTPARHRGRVIDAAAAVVCADGKVTETEAELLRGFADLLDCPMPPLLPGQTIAPA